MLRGRCLQLDLQNRTLVVRNADGIFTRDFTGPTPLPVREGDIVELDDDGTLRQLTPNRTRSGSSAWMERTLDPRRRRGVAMRTRVESAIREYFLARDFLETRTPLLVPSPGMEPHIRPFKIEGRPSYLPTSPEFAMKRLLAGGLERIFQICPAFRDEPESVTHHPEFTMLEWYRAYAGYEDIMRDTEELFDFVARKIHGRPVIPFQGREISVAAPWPRLRVRDLFKDLCGIELTEVKDATRFAELCRERGLSADPSREDWDDLYFKIWLNLIEPRLPADRAVFVTRYPASQAALSVIDSDPDGSRWARRFEAYAGGLELGNAFEELTDPTEQRKRFEKDMELRERLYGASFPKSPMDEGFLHALTEGMPPAGGIAMGVDRIVMLLADEPDIRYTQWLETHSDQAIVI